MSPNPHDAANTRDARHAELVEHACRYIDQHAEALPPLRAVAAHVGVSPSHLHRVFKRVVGVTPRDYARARQNTQTRDALERAGSVTEAIYEAGYSAPSRFYEASASVLGMTPSQYRAGGEAQTIRFAVGACSLGALLVAETARGLCEVALGDDPEALVHALERRFPKAELVGGDAAFEARVAQVASLVEEPRRPVELPLDIRGTAFQQRVWRALQTIPPGETVSYSGLAERIGRPTAARAVARACATNTLAVVVPCHRVVRTDGGLSGYRWGIERKRALLEREGALAPVTEEGAVT